ncbi:hypothetical protein [Microseira sp. BLCC-F43]|jgi:hypothetical protein|uniref:hypothetical protein n=1 Tax=Microseira sp. BLCC-F43 TaxID=3153602 RepID=UPI0035BB5C51
MNRQDAKNAKKKIIGDAFAGFDMTRGRSDAENEADGEDYSLPGLDKFFFFTLFYFV